MKTIMTRMFPLDHQEAVTDIGKLLQTHKYLETPDMSIKELQEYVDNVKIDVWNKEL